MHAWYSPNNKLVKSMWQMAVHQHQFYLEKKVGVLVSSNFSFIVSVIVEPGHIIRGYWNLIG